MRPVLIATAAVAALGTAPQRDLGDPLTVEDGQRLEPKIVEILENASRATDDSETETAVVKLPEREVNAYLRFQGAAQFPPGVTDPWVSMRGEGRVSAAATVDLDAVRYVRERELWDPLRYVGGRGGVIAQGTFHTGEGVGLLEIESVTVGGVPMPTAVLRELVRYYSRSESRPEGFDPSEPFPLPYRIREVFVGEGRAVITQ